MAAAMITLVKRFTYRGDPLEEWSNSYHLTDHPTTLTGWVSLASSLVSLERLLYTSASQVNRALVYENSDNPATYSIDAATYSFAGTGTLSSTGASLFAGDQAATVGWKTGLTGSSGKPIWLRKYFHGGIEQTATPDSLQASYLTALQTFATSLLTTAIDASIFFADKNSRRPDGPRRVDPYSTTRTLKRRGKRPTS